MTLKYIWRSFQPRLSFLRLFQQSLACFRVARSPSNSWASCFTKWSLGSFVYATADEAVAYMFYRCFFCFVFVFCFLSVHQNYETTVLGNGWTNFHETFTKRYRETWSLKRRAAAWRMANVDLRNLRYDSAAGYGNPQSELRYGSGAITRGRHARRLRYKIMSARMDLI